MSKDLDVSLLAVNNNFLRSPALTSSLILISAVLSLLRSISTIKLVVKFLTARLGFIVTTLEDGLFKINCLPDKDGIDSVLTSVLLLSESILPKPYAPIFLLSKLEMVNKFSVFNLVISPCML